MKKLLWSILLVSAPLLAHNPVTVDQLNDSAKKRDCCSSSQSSKPGDPQYGYFFTDSAQDLAVDEAIDWTSNSVHSNGIWVHSSNPNRVVLVEPGVYLAKFIINGQLPNIGENIDHDFSFALFLNDELLPITGSVYSTTTYDDPDDTTIEVEQLNGQVIFQVCDKCSYVTLVNVSSVGTVVTLNNDIEGPGITNVSASIVLQKLDSLH